MATRGDVLALKRRIGFGAGDMLERVVVLSSERHAPGLETVIVAPLDEAIPLYERFPGAVAVALQGGRRDETVVALLPFLGSVPLSRFEAAVVARLDRRGLHAVDRVLKLLLGLV